MVVNIREGDLEAEDIINIIRNANPNIVVDNILEDNGESHTLELIAQDDTQGELNRNVNNLITMLRNIHPGITIERRTVMNEQPIVMERVHEDVTTKKENTKRSARGIR